MLLIPCPWCGPRNQIEFVCGGDATVTRPAPEAPEAEWIRYVYARANPMGRHVEWWLHAAGCRRWIRIHRDTLTHEILAGGDPEVPPPRTAP